MEAPDLHVFFAGRSVKGSVKLQAALERARSLPGLGVWDMQFPSVRGASGICFADNWQRRSAK